jgi:hypothetical protein
MRPQTSGQAVKTNTHHQIRRFCYATTLSARPEMQLRREMRNAEIAIYDKIINKLRLLSLGNGPDGPDRSGFGKPLLCRRLFRRPTSFKDSRMVERLRTVFWPKAKQGMGDQHVRPYE